MRIFYLSCVAMAATVAGCGGSSSVDAGAMDLTATARDLVAGGDLASAGGDLASGGDDLAASGDLASGGGDLTSGSDGGGGGDGGGGNTVSGVNCFAVGAGSCNGGTPYDYYCFGLSGPEMGCVAGSNPSTFCCPHKLCVSYTSADAACGVKPGYPHYYSCQPGLTPSGTCVGNGMSNGMDDFCCQ